MLRQEPTVAVVGCGHWGKNLVRNLSELGALAAVSDPHGPTAGKFSSEFKVPALGWDDILADGKIDGVVIAAPAALHAKLARQALDAGKHVYIEKPLALDIAEAQALGQRAGETGRVLMVGHLLQYHPIYMKLRAMVRAGELGRLQYVYSNRLSLGKIRREENVLWSFAPHDISMILGLVGEEPERIEGISSPILHAGLSDMASVHLTFPSGVRGHVFVSWLHPFKEQRLVAIGDAGMAVFDDTVPWAEKLTVYRHKIAWREGMPLPEKAEGEAVSVPQAEPLKEECRHFLDCIAAGTRPRTDAAEGLAVLKVLRAADDQASRRAGTAGRFPGVKIHESAYVDEPVEIGEGTRIWHFSHLLGHVKVGRDCSVGQNVVIGPNVTIGDNCKIQNNVSLYDGVTLEDGVFCGPSCVFTNVNNPRSEIQRKDEFRRTLVKRGASIGANATIVCGHTLGDYCFIAAGATVTRDVPAYALMAGVPAKRIGWMSKAGGRLGADLICPIDGTRYQEIGGARLQQIEDTV